MVQVSIPRGAPLAGIALLGLAAAVLLSVTLHPAVGVLGALLGLLALALGSAGAHGRSRRQAARPARLPGPVAQRSVRTADGVTRQALVVPLTQTDDFQFVLTVDGYMLVNDRGEVVYKLKR